MDRSAVKAIVDRAIEPLMEQLGIPHWNITVEYGLREDDGISQTNADCTRKIDYNQARIRFDPDEMDDEEHVLKTLRHELFHVVLSPFDLLEQVARGFVTSPEAHKVLDRVWDHVVEKTAINLNRMYLGLTSCPTPEEDQAPDPAPPSTSASAANPSSPTSATTAG